MGWRAGFSARQPILPGCSPLGDPFFDKPKRDVGLSTFQPQLELCLPYGCGSKNRYQNGTLVSGNMDQNPRNPSWSILSHTLLEKLGETSTCNLLLKWGKPALPLEQRYVEISPLGRLHLCGLLVVEFCFETPFGPLLS